MSGATLHPLKLTRPFLPGRLCGVSKRGRHLRLQTFLMITVLGCAFVLQWHLSAAPGSAVPKPTAKTQAKSSKSGEPTKENRDSHVEAGINGYWVTAESYAELTAQRKLGIPVEHILPSHMLTIFDHESTTFTFVYSLPYFDALVVNMHRKCVEKTCTYYHSRYGNELIQTRQHDTGEIELLSFPVVGPFTTEGKPLSIIPAGTKFYRLPSEFMRTTGRRYNVEDDERRKGVIIGFNGSLLSVKPGTPIKVVFPGRVIRAEGPRHGAGGLVLIDHGSGIVSGYGPIAKPTVRVGQILAAGEQLGESVAGPEFPAEPVIVYMIWTGGATPNPFRGGLNFQNPMKFDWRQVPRPDFSKEAPDPTKSP